MRSGDRVCKACKKQWSKELQKRVRIEKWKKHVKENEANLERCVKAATKQRISYGKYMALSGERSGVNAGEHFSEQGDPGKPLPVRIA